MATTFSPEEALAVFRTIDDEGDGFVSKQTLQTYCSSNNINWSTVFTALELNRNVLIKQELFLAAAAEGKLALFKTEGDHELLMRNLDAGG